MNSQYFKSYLNFKEDSKVAYESYLQRIQKSFESLQKNHSDIACMKFQSELQSFKIFRNIKPKHRQEIYKYFVERNVKNFHFLINNQQIENRILKLTKTPLEDYQLDWKDLWERILARQPQPSASKSYSELLEFLRNIRHLYDPNNAIQVIEYFISRHSLYNENLFLFISLFTNLSNKTSPHIFQEYFKRLMELYQINVLKASSLLVLFINAAKFKNSKIPEEMYEELNKIIIYSITTPNSDKKDSFQQKFSTNTSDIIVKIIGKNNPSSINLLQQIFQIIKNFIRPFQDSKRPLKFLYQIISGISKRIYNQQSSKDKIAKLKEKQEKRLKKQAKKAIALKRQEQQNEDSNQTQPNIPEQQAIEPSKVEQPKEEDEQESQEEDENQHDSDDQDENNKMQKLVSMQLDIQDFNQEKSGSLQSKIEKIQAILKNKITSEITECLRGFVGEYFQNIFYVNSKKIVNRLLKDLFKLFPQFVKKSFDALEKAGEIPQINEQGLISNIKHMAKYLFSKQIRAQPQFTDSILRILARIQGTRRITDVWQIINIVTQRLPLVDEKDMENIPEEDKKLFQEKFGSNHDRFYENYSQTIFQCLKRMFSESDHYDNSTSLAMEKSLLDLLINCYPHYKKRLLKEIEEYIIQNNNKFLLTVFQSGLKPSKRFEEELRKMIENRNMDNDQNLELDINVNLLLSADAEISSLKSLIRKYGKKNNYKFLKQCMLNINTFNLVFTPLQTSLQYFDKKPEVKLTQDPTYPFLADKFKHVYDYSVELIDQLANELKQFEEQPLSSWSQEDILKEIYGKKKLQFKNMKIEKRKVINELLQILKTIMESLPHSLQQFIPDGNLIITKQCYYNRLSLIHNQNFVKILKTLVYNELFLHDHNIMQNLSLIIENETFFMYKAQIKQQKQIIRRYTKKNEKQELNGQVNLISMHTIFIAKARLAFLSILNNKYKDSVGIKDIQRELGILMIAPSNDKSNIINKILVIKSDDTSELAEKYVYLLNKSFDSRFYYEKVFTLLAEFNSANPCYTAKQIVQIIDLHVPLIQSETIKIREQSLKSLQKFLKTLNKQSVFGQVQRSLRKYITRQKLEIIWIMAIIIILKDSIKHNNIDDYLQDLSEYMKILEKMIVSETRIIRRASIFVYSCCFRKAKKAVKIYETKEVDNIKYSQPKTIYEFFKTGYIREQHMELKSLCNRTMVKKMQPYTVFTTKQKRSHPIFQKIEQDSFSFIINNPKLGAQIVKQFHIDMASSVEQVISMMHNKKHDLVEICMRLLEGCYMYSKLKKIYFDRIQYYFGERFFRYLFDKDFKANQCKVFFETKPYIQEQLSNLQPYDNQTLAFVYTIDVFLNYQKHSAVLSPQNKLQIEKFLLKIIGQIIYKGSGILFKKLMVIFSKIAEIDSIKFLIDYFEGLLKNKEKVPRISQLLFAIYQQNYIKFKEITSFILQQRIQINNVYLNSLINTIVLLPQKLIVTNKVIQKFGVIDKEVELENKRIQRYKQDVFLLSTNTFNASLIQKLNQYIDDAIKIGEGESQKILQEKNQLTKSVYTLVTNAISAYIQFYETEQTIDSILKLLEILFRLFDLKMDHFVDFKQFQETLKNIFSNKYEDISNFEKIIYYTLTNLGKVPIKKQVDVIKIMSNRPGNFLFLKKQTYKDVLVKMLKLQENSMFYRDLLVAISTILAYVPLSDEQITQLSVNLSKSQTLLLLSSHVLSTLDIGSKFVQKILKESGKDRRNIFCKQILIVRGKKEYLDDEQKYNQWKQIKQYSNPYHYHA